MMINLFLAALCSLCGVGGLYASWRGYWPRRLTVPGAWCLLVLSCVFWVRGLGAEFGSFYALISISLCAWLAVAFNYETRRLRPEKPRGPSRKVLPDSHSLTHNVMLFLFAVPLAGAAAILFSVWLVRLLPWADVNAMVLGIVLMPVFWGVASYWVCAAARPLRPALALTSCVLLCGTFIYGPFIQ